jgi:hypothetical protein
MTYFVVSQNGRCGAFELWSKLDGSRLVKEDAFYRPHGPTTRGSGLPKIERKKQCIGIC